MHCVEILRKKQEATLLDAARSMQLCLQGLFSELSPGPDTRTFSRVYFGDSSSPWSPPLGQHRPLAPAVLSPLAAATPQEIKYWPWLEGKWGKPRQQNKLDVTEERFFTRNSTLLARTSRG